MEHKSDFYVTFMFHVFFFFNSLARSRYFYFFSNCNWRSWYRHRRIDKGTGGFGNKRTSGDHTNYCIIEIGQNTEKGPRDLRDCCHSNSNARPSAYADVKNSQEVNNDSNNNNHDINNKNYFV